jgi:hypothetical protein
MGRRGGREAVVHHLSTVAYLPTAEALARSVAYGITVLLALPRGSPVAHAPMDGRTMDEKGSLRGPRIDASPHRNWEFADKTMRSKRYMPKSECIWKGQRGSYFGSANRSARRIWTPSTRDRAGDRR